MGWAAFVNTHNLTAFDTDDLSEGSSNLYFTNARAQSAAQAVSINNVVEDTTPQLGGNLDVNAKNINFGDSASSSYDRLNFGAGTDLSIFHDGSDNTIKTTSDLNFDTADKELVISGTSQFETKDFVVSGSRTGTGGAISRVVWRNRGGSTDINADAGETRIEGWRISGNTPSLVFNFGGNQRHRFDTDGKVALGAVPSSFGAITETVEITGTLKTTSTAKLTGVEVTGNTTISGTLNGHTIPSGSGTLALTSDISSGAINVQDEGSALSTQATTLNFVGSGVTASGTGTTKTITINTSGGGGGGGSGANVSWSVAQSSHGLAVGDVIYNNGTNYVKAQANSETSLGLFVVSAVADTDNFTATFSGKITLSSLIAGQFYFVSPTTAGDFTTTEPTGSNFSNPILFALSTTEAVVLPYRPALGASGAGAGRTVLDVFSKAETNQQVSAFAIALG